MGLERLVYNGILKFKTICVFFSQSPHFFFLIARKLEQIHFKSSQHGIAVFCSEYQQNHIIIGKKTPKQKPIKEAPTGFNRFPSGLKY